MTGLLVANSADPTATLTLRNTYARAMRRHFTELARTVKAHIRQSFTQIRALGVIPFMAWFRQQMDRLILEATRPPTGYEAFTPTGQIDRSTGWQRPYVESAYLRGIAMADRELAQADFVVVPLAFLGIRPYGNQIDAAVARNYTDLQAITEALAGQVEGLLASGIPVDAETLVALVIDRITKVGISRGEILARTLVIWTFAMASLDRYESAGVGMVTGLVELVTAKNPCPRCAALAGTYTIEEARGLIPAHSRCRCRWRPLAGVSRRQLAALSGRVKIVGSYAAL